MRSLLILIASASIAHADAPLSLAWNLRAPAPSSVVRFDNVAATFVDKNVRGETYASTFTLAVKILPHLAPLVRVTSFFNEPASGPKAGGVSNPVVGFVFGPPVSGALKVAVLGGLALPLGSGGGNTGTPARLAAEKATALARSAMDNSMFAVNDLTPTLGFDIAYVDHGVTLQAEATLFELFRVRGEKVQPDEYKTNFTTGAHVGYFLVPWLCVSGELRYQRYLTTPVAVEMNPAARDNLTAGGGLRFAFKLGGHRLLRPGVSYSRALDQPLADRTYQIVQLDLPFSF
ncbi:MAG: hypothetical protein JO257_25415 [Deltaproteobacteria bacterium]|nr:hypothetical protein [Deltaproteobacteria bacterium]